MTLSLEAMIEKRHSGDGWILMFELGNGTGYNVKRHADAVAIGIWPSHGHEIHGYEVKRSRGDVQRELAEPSKADAVGQFCDYWWLVVENEALIDGLVIPATWGVLAPRSQVLRVLRKAPKRKATPVGRSFSAAIIRRVCSEWVPRRQLQELERKTLEDARLRAENEAKYKHDDAIEELDVLKRKVEVFERESGLQIIDAAPWTLGNISEAVKVVVEARTISGSKHANGYDAPEQLVATEIARMNATIKRHDFAREALISSRDRLEILKASFATTEPPLPELPE